MIRKIKDMIDTYRINKMYKKLLASETSTSLSINNINHLNVIDI